MERLKKTNQTMLAVVGFLTAIIPAFTFAEKLYTMIKNLQPWH